MLRYRPRLVHLHTYLMLRYRPRLLHLHTYLMLRYRPRLLHLHTYLMLRYRPRLLHLHTWCYATDGLGWGGVGWGGLITFNGTHTWCYATSLFSCTCTHSWCYATDLISCTCTHSWCYATRLFSCTPTHCCARKNRKVRFFCSLPVAKRKSIKKQSILKQPLSTPGVHKRVQIQVKNDEKIKHNGISHIFWPIMMMIASKVLQIPKDKHEGHHKDS